MLKKEWILFALILLFLTSLFVPVFTSLKVISMSAVMAYALCFSFIRPASRIYVNTSTTITIIALSTWLLASYFYSDDKHDYQRFLTLRLPLLLLPVTVGIIEVRKCVRDKTLLAFSFLVVLACLVSFTYALYHRITEGYDHWLYNDSLSFFIGQQSIYTSLLVNVAIFVLAYYFFHNTYPRLKPLIIISTTVLLVISFLLASRNMMVVLYATMIAVAGYQVARRKKYKLALVLLLVIIVAAGAVLYLSPKTLNRFKELTYTNFNYSHVGAESHYATRLSADQWNGANFRLAAWACGWQLAKQHPVAGVGLGDKRNELNRIYKERNFAFALATNKNVHNNYLDTLYSLGIIGLLLFMAGWFVFPAGRFIQTKDTLALLVLITFAIAMVTENYFDRSLGSMTFAFFISFFIAASRRRLPDQ